jgi:hypothetical protein
VTKFAVKQIPKRESERLHSRSEGGLFSRTSDTREVITINEITPMTKYAVRKVGENSKDLVINDSPAVVRPQAGHGIPVKAFR